LVKHRLAKQKHYQSQQGAMTRRRKNVSNKKISVWILLLSSSVWT